MFSWKITKYAPNGDRNEWTSIHDIGKIYDGRELTADEYFHTEHLYLEAIRLIAQCNIVSSFSVTDLELYQEQTPQLIYNGHPMTVDLETAILIAQRALREELWCRLSNPDMFVHFGYDYYMYIGSKKKAEHELEQIRMLGLYVVPQESPYQIYLEDKGTVSVNPK